MGPAEFWVLEAPAAGNTNRKLSLVEQSHLDRLMVVSYRYKDGVVVFVPVHRIVLLREGSLQKAKEQKRSQLIQVGF